MYFDCRECRYAYIEANDIKVFSPEWQETGAGFFTVCQTCGNKRCPHADDHRYLCTNSNESNQEPVMGVGWAERMDQKFKEMVADPEEYFRKARKEAYKNAK